jgi:nicotinamidase-related amidase
MSRSPLVLARETALLVFVDVQERLHAEVARREEAAAAQLKLARAARILGVPVLLTEHAAKAFGPTVAPLREALAGVGALHKIVFSCFGSEEFGRALESLGRRQLLLCGYETHICVCQTALDAVARGYQVHVARDASSARSEESHRLGIEKMAFAGVVPASTETALFELLERAGTDEFRAVLPIIKGT